MGKNSMGKNTKSKASSDKLSSVESEQKVLEHCMNKLTLSAIQIQRWWRRHRRRNLAGEAAMKRLLAQKKTEHELRMSQARSPVQTEEQKAEERKRIREEK